MKRAVAALLVALFTVSISSCSNEPFSLFTQHPTWTSCESGDFECATVEVPIDWNTPGGKRIGLAIIRKSSGKNQRSLVLNPGGPGASGYDFLKENYADIGTAALRKAYTFVSFDPRGVKRSAGIKCFDNKGTDQFLYDAIDAEPGSAKEIQLASASIKEFAAACQKNSGEIMGHVDTISAARDMEVIRTALGERDLNYLGYSYGTFLGTTYAALFPQHVGKFVLDGAIDPNVPDEQQNLGQLAGFDLALTDYLKDCLANDNTCPFTGNLANAKKQLQAFLLKMEHQTLPTTSGRKLTISSATTGLIMALYSDSYWQYLTQAFVEAFAGKGDTFMRLADFYNDRNDDGTYASNTFEANFAVNCLDSRASSKPADMAAQNRRILKASPILGRYWQNGALACANWPFPLVGQLPSYRAKGAPTIMVIGTTGDPATPYSEAVALAHNVLRDAVLVTFKGEGHTAYGRSNECVSSAVDDFLILGKLPATEPVC